MRIAFFSTKPYDKEAFDPLAKDMNIEIDYFGEQLTPETVSLAKGYDATCSFVNDNVDATAVKALKDYGIKAILLRCAGFDSVDLDKAKELDLPVLRVPAYSPEAVAEFAATLLLAVNRRVHTGYNRSKEFNFEIDGLRGMVLKGKTAGVIGTGRIGKATINILRGFGMNVIAYDIYQDTESDINYVSLDELFAKSDVITLHTPLTPETEHMINSETIAKMKDGVILINTARGGLINTEDLIKALEEDKFRGVGLDVCEQESEYFFEDNSHVINKDRTLQRLVSFNKVLLTGHQAFFTDESMDAIAEVTLNNLKNFVENGDLTNEVNLFLESIQG
ncbi:MAG TPA: 2-hydroxyacid dehydrogenase [Tepidimicrobium sp.]|nr:2-hydroxyacid dehydrogenase [Tepidimicrobium sp.]